jgi:hypothetical protein
VRAHSLGERVSSVQRVLENYARGFLCWGALEELDSARSTARHDGCRTGVWSSAIALIPLRWWRSRRHRRVFAHAWFPCSARCAVAHPLGRGASLSAASVNLVTATVSRWPERPTGGSKTGVFVLEARGKQVQYVSHHAKRPLERLSYEHARLYPWRSSWSFGSYLGISSLARRHVPRARRFLRHDVRPDPYLSSFCGEASSVQGGFGFEVFVGSVCPGYVYEADRDCCR